MSMSVVEVLVILVLVLANGAFAMAELAVVSSQKGRLRRLSESGDRGARAALELAEDPNRFLATVQAGITLVGTLAGGAVRLDLEILLTDLSVPRLFRARAAGEDGSHLVHRAANHALELLRERDSSIVSHRRQFAGRNDEVVEDLLLFLCHHLSPGSRLLPHFSHLLRHHGFGLPQTQMMGI